MRAAVTPILALLVLFLAGRNVRLADQARLMEDRAAHLERSLKSARVRPQAPPAPAPIPEPPPAPPPSEPAPPRTPPPAAPIAIPVAPTREPATVIDSATSGDPLVQLVSTTSLIPDDPLEALLADPSISPTRKSLIQTLWTNRKAEVKAVEDRYDALIREELTPEQAERFALAQEQARVGGALNSGRFGYVVLKQAQGNLQTEFEGNLQR